jgi:hypothetical protein
MASARIHCRNPQAMSILAQIESLSVSLASQMLEGKTPSFSLHQSKKPKAQKRKRHHHL